MRLTTAVRTLGAAFTAVITEAARWTAGGHSNVSWRRVSYAELPTSAVAGTDPLDRAALKAVEENPAAVALENKRVLYTTLVSGQQRSMLSIAPDARDTYAGGVIRCQHDLSITLRTGQCITNPEVKVNLRIGTPPVAALPMPAYGMTTTTTTTTTTMVTTVPVGAVPVISLPEGMPLSPEEQQAVAAVPADWSGAVVAEAFVVPMGMAVLGGTAAEAAEGGTGGDGLAVPAYPMASAAGGADEDATRAKLQQLAQLREQGMLTDGEYEEAKKRTIGHALGGRGGQDGGGGNAMAAAAGTMDALLLRMHATFDDLSLLSGLANEEAWRPFFASLDPSGYGLIVGTTNMEVAQPSVAELLASQLGGRFTCAHCATAVEKASASYPGTRTGIVQKVARYCVDLELAADVIRATLTPWEQIVTSAALELQG